MCRTYNKIGSLTTLKSQLAKNKIYDFKSLKEVIDFKKSFPTYRQQIIAHHENLIEHEKNVLKTDLQHLDTAIETHRQQSEQRLTGEIDKLKQRLNISTSIEPANYFQKLTRVLSEWNCKWQIKCIELIIYLKVKKSIRELVDIRQVKINRYQFINSQYNDAVSQSSRQTLSELERKKATIDGLNSFISGALGEHKVVNTLEALSDDYFLINDFAISFSPAIYNSQDNDYIKSVQIDHLLVAPSGIFLIETKNWSEKSLEDLSLRSPVQQIRRTSFVLFKLLNNEMSKFQLHLDKHHWGDRKISIKNLIVLVNTKPKEEFQHVKILTLKELLGYINYFKPTFSSSETQKIADFLISINNQKTIATKR